MNIYIVYIETEANRDTILEVCFFSAVQSVYIPYKALQEYISETMSVHSQNKHCSDSEIQKQMWTLVHLHVC